MSQERMFSLVDLFSGAGGLTAGFCCELGAGYAPFVPTFTPVFAIDSNPDAGASYTCNFGDHVIVDSIQNIRLDRTRDGRFGFSNTRKDGSVIRTIPLPAGIDVVVGGPPCQGFSPLGRMNNWRKEDPRNSLWVYFMHVVRELLPSIFLLENVPEILTSRQGQAILDEAHQLGYFLAAPRVLDASAYGVPQKRRRAFILGSRIGPIELPPPTGVTITVREAFRELPGASGDPLHILRNPTETSLLRYRAIPEGGNRFDLMNNAPDITPKCWMNKPTGSTDVMGRLWWDRPAVTIRTEFFKPEKGRYLHPSEDRPITHREAAVLQTFPNSFVFMGSKIEIARQIGNAVPPVLAYHIASVIHRRLLAPMPEGPVNSTPDLAALHQMRQLTLGLNGD